MASDRHIIHRQLIDIKLSDKAEAQHWQNEFSTFYKSVVLRGLERACDELCPENAHIRINKLEIDLGMIRHGKLQPELAQDLIRQFKKEILKVASEKLYLTKPAQTGEKEAVLEGVSAISGKSASLYDSVIYYIEYGMLPWWAPARGFNIRKSIDQLIGNKTEKLSEKQFFDRVRSLLRRKNCQLRVIDVFTAKQLAFIFYPGNRYFLFKLYTDFKKLDTRKSLKFIFFKNVLKHATLAPIGFNLIEMPKVVLETLQELGYDVEKPTLLSKVKKKVAFDGPLIYLIGKYLKEKTRSTTGYQSEVKEWKSKKSSGNEKDALEHSIKGRDKVGMETIQDIEKTSTLPLDQKGKGNRQLDFDVDRPHPPFLFHPDGMMELANAGTVLLWPYLQMFFRELKMVESGGFIDKSCQEKAVQLLHFLVNSEAEAEEHQWILFKLLCGMEPIDFVPTLFELSDSEMKECDNLLRSVIRNWSVLKSTSPAGLQSSFLRRPGLLKRDQNGWIVQIERIAIDVLLDRLTWPISVIRLPWTKNAIHVRW